MLRCIARAPAVMLGRVRSSERNRAPWRTSHRLVRPTLRVARAIAKVVVLALAIGLFARVILRADLAHLRAQLAALGPWVLVALLPYVVAIGCDTIGWRQLLARLGHRVALARLFGVRLASEAVLLSLPAGAVVAESVKPWLLTREGVPVTDSAATLAAKKTLTIATHGVYLLLALATGVLATIAPRLPMLVAGAAGVLLVLATAMLASLRSAAVAARLHRALSAIPVARARRWLSTWRDGFHTTDTRLRSLLFPADHLLASAVPFLLCWLAESFESFVLLSLLGTGVTFFDALAIEAGMSVLRTIAFFVPAGLGVQDVAWVSALGALGVPDATRTGAAFVTLKRGKELCWIVVGYVVLALMRSELPQRASQSESS